MRLENYWWLLIWPFLFRILGFLWNMQREEDVDGKQCVRWKPLPACLLAAPYVIWAGWRQTFGDTEQYRGTFLSMPSELSQIRSYMEGVEKAHGFRLIELLFKCLVSKSDIAFFVFIAAIQMGCLVYIYRKYSTNYWLSIFFFVASTDYLSWMHNGIRQFLAATIIFLCIPLVAKRKYLMAIAIILVAAMIHSSALLVVPFVLVINGKSWNIRTLAFGVAVFVAVVYADYITGFLATFLEDTAYEGDIIFLTSNDGTNILRALFYSVPAVLTLFFRPYVDEANDPLINVCANLSIITTGFYIFSVYTSGILMGAIPIYFSLSNYILIPWLIQNVFDRDSVFFVEILFIAVYIVFFYFQCGPTWGVL